MGIWDNVRGEFIDIVQWIDDTNDTMVYRFERYNNQIKYGAQLTVREGQTAVFVNEGKIADVFQPGMYSLETKNMPILSTLQGRSASVLLAADYGYAMTHFRKYARTGSSSS